MVKRKPKKKKSSESTFMDDPVDSILSHIGKFADNLKPSQVIDIIAAFTCAAGGYKAAERLGGNTEAKLGAAGSAILAYQLAKSANVVAGGSGTLYLAGLGLINVWNPLTDIIGDPIEKALKLPFPFGLGLGWEFPPKLAIRA